MKALTQDGQRHVDDIAAKYNVTSQSVETLLRAVVSGSGTMAQFNIPELGGQGQWMKGGMTMVGDMFNNSLRATVDKLCAELAELIVSKVLLEERNTAEEDVGNLRSSVSTPWPSVFGNPTATGSQNNFRYAYFAPVHRLVIEENGKRAIYDTKHHQISGISQQQGTTGSYKFTSQEGTVDLGSLSIVSDPDKPAQPTPEMAYDVTGTADLRSGDQSPQDIIIATIGKLNILLEKGQITEEEFKAKKEELLGRL
nr:SHOCT domain-containing protein [uncultured Dyadobacter sp.]